MQSKWKFSGESSDQPTASVTEFDDILDGPLKKFLDVSAKIGNDVAKHAEMVRAAFDAQREFVLLASKAKQPSADELPELLKPMSDKIAEIQGLREKERR